MDISLFLAQVFGLYFILAGLAILIRPTATSDVMRALAKRDVIFLGGFFILLLGVSLALLHNIWDGTWRIVISVLVWLTVLKGVLGIFAPELIVTWAEALSPYPQFIRHLVWLLIILGLYLSYIGFGWAAWAP